MSRLLACRCARCGSSDIARSFAETQAPRPQRSHHGRRDHALPRLCVAVRSDAGHRERHIDCRAGLTCAGAGVAVATGAAVRGRGRLRWLRYDAGAAGSCVSASNVKSNRCSSDRSRSGPSPSSPPGAPRIHAGFEVGAVACHAKGKCGELGCLARRRIERLFRDDARLDLLQHGRWKGAA